MTVEWTITAECDHLPNHGFEKDALNATYSALAAIVESYLGELLHSIDIDVKVTG